MAIFGYGRVSTTLQTTENQRLELERSGFTPDYWFQDTGISGKTVASERTQFKLMLEKIRDGETLVVSKLDRLGRDAIDVLSTVRLLEQRQIQVIVLQLGKTDLTSPTGKLLLTMLSAVAAMERDLLIERTQAGLERAKAEGKRLGRPSKTSPDQKETIRKLFLDGVSISKISRMYSVSRATVLTITR